MMTGGRSTRSRSRSRADVIAQYMSPSRRKSQQQQQQQQYREQQPLQPQDQQQQPHQQGQGQRNRSLSPPFGNTASSRQIMGGGQNQQGQQHGQQQHPLRSRDNGGNTVGGGGAGGGKASGAKKSSSSSSSATSSSHRRNRSGNANANGGFDSAIGGGGGGGGGRRGSGTGDDRHQSSRTSSSAPSRRRDGGSNIRDPISANAAPEPSAPTNDVHHMNGGGGGGGGGRRGRSKSPQRHQQQGQQGQGHKKMSLIERARSRSRSRSKSASRGGGRGGRDGTGHGHGGGEGGDENGGGGGPHDRPPMLVAVTSCRSDAYHQQKAPGSAAMLPRKAPSALKLFHELAVGIKDAYEALGAAPRPPPMSDEGGVVVGRGQTREEVEGTKVLYDFMCNVDLLLALVDEVATDTHTRGALKDDNKFKSLRDVIKKCNKILEAMLVRRERKYTLFFRLVQPLDRKEVSAMRKWNSKLDKAVGSVAAGGGDDGSDDESEAGGSSVGGSSSASTAASSSVGGGGGPSPHHGHVTHAHGASTRGRSLLPTAGKVRSRRATPTPRLRQRNAYQPGVGGSGGSSVSSSSSDGANAAEDGFSAVTAPGGLGQAEGSILNPGMVRAASSGGGPPGGPPSVASRTSTPLRPNAGGGGGNVGQTLSFAKPVKAKDELVDVIKGLKVEREMIKANGGKSSPTDIKPNWHPKAEIPSTVPKLPAEYIHRHRLMKQAVNCLLSRTGAGPRDSDNENPSPTFITSITSRHADKAGNGKTTLAVAAIQTVEVRERFSDGIAWIKLGRKPLTEKDIRGLYEEIYCQLSCRESCPEDEEAKGNGTDPNAPQSVDAAGHGNMRNDNDQGGATSEPASPDASILDKLARSRRRFQGGELEGIREDLSQLFCKRKILLCLDDVWRAEDACWFLFNQNHNDDDQNGGKIGGKRGDDFENPFQIMITTRFPGLLGNGMAQEVFVRIFTEHEAIKLLLSSAGRRPNGAKNSPVFSDARLVVKGCGNSPLAVRLAGGMLRKTKRWTITSPTWTSLVAQCKSCLSEATQMRSFSKSFGRIVDLSFSTIEDKEERAALRRCFVVFAMIFHNNELMRVGKGIPRDIVLCLFSMVQGAPINGKPSNAETSISPASLLATLETMNLLEKARPDLQKLSSTVSDAQNDEDDEDSTGNGVTKTEATAGETGQTEADAPASSGSSRCPQCYLMHDSIGAIAEEMAARKTPSFSPPDSSSEEPSQSIWSTPLRNAAKYFVQLAQRIDSKDAGMAEYQFHELIVASLTGGWSAISRKSIVSVINRQADLGPGVEDYIVAYLPSHLIRSKALANAGEVLVDPKFVTRRVTSMGPIEATRKQVADLIELRRAVSRGSRKDADQREIHHSSPKTPKISTPVRSRGSPMDGPSTPGDINASEENSQMDIGATLRDGSRRIIDEVYRVDSADPSLSSTLSLNMAICLSIVGEGLLKCRQPRDAMLRLEEGVGMYRGVLGPYHIDVARSLSCVAKALVKLGESRVAVLKFGEAARIYEACNATQHFDALSNSQSMAALLADLGDFAQAEARYEAVIDIRRSLHGNMNPSVARTLNDYAVVLAKHGKIDEAICQYQEARAAFEGAAASKTTYSFVEAGGEFGFIYDAALIDMNIASIKAKSGDVEGAILSYEAGISKMRQLDKCARIDSATDGRLRHVITSMGKIGSLKLKRGDRRGALDAFEKILVECGKNESCSTPVKVEAAKAHIKCATILRTLPSEGENNHETSLNHLQEALKMYTQLYGSHHRDTQAVAASLRQWQQEDTLNTDNEIS